MAARADRWSAAWMVVPPAVLLLVAPLVGIAWAPADAQQVLRYSGRVERVDLGEGRLVVDELAEKGRRRRHEVYVDDATPIVSSGRLPAWQMRDWRAYDEVPVSLVDVLAGDFVVVESVDEDGRPTARRITIVERPGRSR